MKGLRFFLLDDYFTLIGAAICAYTVREVILAALGALGQAGLLKLPVAVTSLISACFGNLFLRYCHCEILLQNGRLAPVYFHF